MSIGKNCEDGRPILMLNRIQCTPLFLFLHYNSLSTVLTVHSSLFNLPILQEDQTLQELHSWMTTHKITGAALPFLNAKGMHGMRVKQTTPKGAVLLSVPIELSFYEGSRTKADGVAFGKRAENLASLSEIFAAMQHMLEPNAYLAMLLLHEMNHNTVATTTTTKSRVPTAVPTMYTGW